MMRSLTYQSNGTASKDKKSRARLGSAVVIILLAMGLTGCGSDDNINLQDYVKEVFEISGFDSFLPIEATLDDAVKSV